MPFSQYAALVEEYHRDYRHADLKATILNASMRTQRQYSASDFLPSDPAPEGSQNALRNALRHAARKKGGK